MHILQYTSPAVLRRYVREAGPSYALPLPSVYLDTSIPSYLVGRRNTQADIARRQRLTDVWWRRYRVRFALHVSHITLKEASDGDPRLAQLRKNLLQPIIQLASTSLSHELAAALICTRVLPAKAHDDAEHIAIAAVNSMQYLLTWNCKHMANPFIARNVVRTCEAHGFRSPKICTPETLMRICRHERSHP